jgi:pimeloyl-ACP methyl ester carboxylesterase
MHCSAAASQHRRLSTAAEGCGMAPFVLVPGMWHGSWCWEKTTPFLRAAGHAVHLVTLTGVGERAHLHYPEIDLHTHIQDVVSVLEHEDLHQVIVVGHSLAGFMVPAVAEHAPERVGQIVNLDGVIPEDGKAFKDFMPEYWHDFQQRARASGDEGWAPPVLEWTFGVTGADLEWMRSQLTPHPLKTWETPVAFTNPAARSIPRTFIHCTEGASPDEKASQEQDCAPLGWRYRTLPTGHDAMITAPEALAKLLLDFV